MPKKITHHWQLDVYQRAFKTSMRILELTKTFPKEEQYSLTSQIRRSSRSICGQIAEGWRRRRYEPAFCNKMNEAEGEAAETQTWLQYSVECGYLTRPVGRELFKSYDEILRTLVGMINNSEKWVLPGKKFKGEED
jgi:four helix bundle protein